MLPLPFLPQTDPWHSVGQAPGVFCLVLLNSVRICRVVVGRMQPLGSVIVASCRSWVASLFVDLLYVVRASSGRGGQVWCRRAQPAGLAKHTLGEMVG